MKTGIVVVAAVAVFVVVRLVAWIKDIRWRLTEFEMTRARYADFRKEWADLRWEFQKLKDQVIESERRATAWKTQYHWAIQDRKAAKHGN